MQLKPGREDLGFVVLNRPHSLAKALHTGSLSFGEEFVLICETDHLFLKPMPNLANATHAVGYPFHYMLPTRNAKTIALMTRFAGAEHAAAVQQVGPSPVLMHMHALRGVVDEWSNVSFAMKKAHCLPVTMPRLLLTDYHRYLPLTTLLLTTYYCLVSHYLL